MAAALSVVVPAWAQLAQGGTWGRRAAMLEANSEFAVAELDGKVYVLGGYPASRQTQRTVQIYDTRTDTWSLGPKLPAPNNHGMAVAAAGKIYLIGGQTTDAGIGSYVNTVYALDPARGVWETKASMPTARSAAAPVVLNGKIYVAGGRPPRGSDFAVYDPGTDTWTVLPDLPSQRNHIIGAAMNGKVYIAGGRLDGGFQSAASAVFEAFDPVSGRWTTAAPMPRPRSGMNGVLAFGCFHVWGGEGALGMFPDHDVYDPRTNAWTRLANMPIPVHGVTGSAFVDGLIFVPGGGTSIGGNSGTVLNQTFAPTQRCE
jgi:N-acetylneuraminic acid mutarotase